MYDEMTKTPSPPGAGIMKCEADRHARTGHSCPHDGSSVDLLATKKTTAKPFSSSVSGMVFITECTNYASTDIFGGLEDLGCGIDHV